MTVAAAPETTRGLALILEHCERLTSVEDSRPSAVVRLRQAIGEELARVLLAALVGDHSMRPRVV